MFLFLTLVTGGCHLNFLMCKSLSLFYSLVIMFVDIFDAVIVSFVVYCFILSYV